MSDKPIPCVFPKNSMLFGQTYEDVTISFWKWFTSIPADRSPALDRTGERCAEGQFGQPIFNLVFGDGTPGVERKCTLRAGQHLLIPVNVVEVSEIEYPAAKTEEDLHRIAKEEFDDPRNVTHFLSINGKEFNQLKSIDGKEIGDLKEFRVHSRTFDLNFPNNPIFGRPGPTRAVSDGHWAIIEGLPPGENEIYFKASLKNPLTGNLFYSDSVKYKITSLPEVHT
jgi:hypothetical protein